MPSSPSHGASSPLVRGSAVRRSQFTYRQLALMASCSTSNPLRVVAHIDLDAFYAQCEMVRLGVPEDQPLAVQQWQGLIAINYPAREFGITRHVHADEARKRCPSLIAQHVATWREGDDKWAYRDDAAENIATDKVSLDPYRLQSRMILACIKDSLPSNLQRVEKASIDEVFLDLSAHVHSILLQRFPELSHPPPYDDPTEKLPLPSVSALDWQADALVELDEQQESLDPDWDDVAILIGSEIVRSVRARIREQTKYTCSAGVASNKLASKLGSGYKKPNQQTVIRGRALQDFVASFNATKLRNLGGKLGDRVVSEFNTDSIPALRNVPLDQLKQKLGEETGLWLYKTLRGIDTSEVTPRTEIKSMLSAKSFRPYIHNFDQGVKWLQIFVGDIHSRLVDEGVMEHKRRPRSISLHHRHAGQLKSRQTPIPHGKTLDAPLLLDMAKDLLTQIVSEGNVWPCANLSLSVNAFEEGVKGNMGIDAFLVKGEQAEAMRSSTPDSRSGSVGPERQTKKRRIQDDGIQRFFSRPASDRTVQGQLSRSRSVEENVQGDPSAVGKDPETIASGRNNSGGGQAKDPFPSESLPSTEFSDRHSPRSAGSSRGPQRTSYDTYVCSRCGASFEESDVLQSHEDWHMAKDLQAEERVKHTLAEAASAPRSHGRKETDASDKRGGGRAERRRGGKTEQGQRKLNFG